MLKIEMLKRTMATLHFPDPEALKRSRLAPLMKKFDVYPTAHGGRKLLILLPLGMNPKDASKLPENQVASQIVVLAQEANNWAKVALSSEDGASTPAVDTAVEKSETEVDGSIEIVED